MTNPEISYLNAFNDLIFRIYENNRSLVEN